MEQFTFRLKPGQFLKEEIEKTVKDKKILAAALWSVVGNLNNVNLRMPGATPESQEVKQWEGPFEIVSGTGTLSLDGCHIHIAVADKEGRVLGGHLKNGCKVRYTVEIVLGIFKDAEYRRILDEQTGFPELEIIR